MTGILSWLLKKYDPNDTEIYLKAKFVLITTLMVIGGLSAILFYTAYLSGMDNPVVISELLGYSVMLTALVLLVKGKYNIAIQIILIAGFATVWGVLFTKPIISMFAKTDTIVFIIGLIAAMPLMFFKNRKPMVFYFVANLFIYFIYIFYLHKMASFSTIELTDYFLDNLIVMTFVFFVSYSLFSIYKQAMQSLKNELVERKHSENINKTLFAISNAVNVTRNLDELYKQTHELLNDVIDVTNFFIAITSLKDQTLYFPYYIDKTDEDFSPIRDFNPEKSLTGLVVSKRKPVLLKQEALRELSEKNAICGNTPVIWMGVPLMIKDEVIGIIAVQSYTNADLYDETDLKLLSSISDQIAIAVERKRNEDELRKSEKRYRYLFDHSPVGMYEIDFIEQKFKEVNHTFIKEIGYSEKELLSINPFDLLTEESKERLHKRMEKILRGEIINTDVEYEIQRKNGQKLTVILNNDYIYENNTLKGARVVAHNVTELKKIENMIIQSEKMMSVGGLAAGMAHEINNPLAGMMQNAQVIYNRLSQDIKVNREAAEEIGTDMDTIQQFMAKRGILKHLESIHTAGLQASKIVGNMLSFAKKSGSEKSKNRLDELIEKTIELAENDYSLKKNYDFRQIEIIREYGPDVPEVLCEPSKIQQVLFNIVKNASEAMQGKMENKPPRISFRLESTPHDVCIEIEDNGPGIDVQTQKRIFEPFFTTKPVNKGTGLGLSVSYFIIENDHNGKMEVSSTPGKGTKFIIKLPVQ